MQQTVKDNKFRRFAKAGVWRCGSEGSCERKASRFPPPLQLGTDLHGKDEEAGNCLRLSDGVSQKLPQQIEGDGLAV